MDGWLKETLGLGSGVRGLELGAGTGKFTPRLLATGASTVAVEPLPAMLALLRARLPQVPVLAASAQRLPLRAGTFAAVVCAQSFHWFATRASLAEIHRVLAPGGRLGLVWNVRDESVDWVAALSAIIRPHEGDAPRFHSGAWRAAFEGAPFGPLREWHCAHAHVGTPHAVIIERTLSVSFIAALPEAQRAQVAERLRSLVATHPALRNRERIAFPYQTRAWSCIGQPD